MIGTLFFLAGLESSEGGEVVDAFVQGTSGTTIGPVYC